jgi:hypothetical protein
MKMGDNNKLVAITFFFLLLFLLWTRR